MVQRGLFYVIIVFASTTIYGQESSENDTLTAALFGDDFHWGTACAAYQIEGAWNLDGKGESVWDTYAHKKGSIHNDENGDVAVDFYHRYKEDIRLHKEMNFDVFRFSISWARIFPNGVGLPNPQGVEFYHKVIDECISQGIEPWVTLYHWDLPQALEDQGGWTNREVIKWFSDYTQFCAEEYGDKVKNWLVMNEPAAFVGLGYMTGDHAPGKKGASKFLRATHYTCLAMAESGRVLRSTVANANIGSTFSCSPVTPFKNKKKNAKAVTKIDALLNRLFIEPSLGLGYPYDGFPALKKIKKYFEEGDLERLKFDFDFIGLQNYFRVVAKRTPAKLVVWCKQVDAKKRDVPVNKMGFEIYPEGIYQILKQFGEYEGIKEIIVTENGVCVKDSLENGRVHDPERIAFFQSYLGNVLKAKQEGVPVNGYFVWSLTDNFEWSEGFEPRFGLIYVDYTTLNRTLKDSGLWFKKLLAPTE
ncbi:MAG: beta-glucosidase [Crocinitomicaceae bacterium]|jgi:beta-glucosidase